MYVSCVYLATTSEPMLLPFLVVALFESDTRKVKSWSVTYIAKLYPVNANLLLK